MKGGDVRIFGRPKKDGGIPEYTVRLPEVVDGLRHISASSFEVVGEAVVFDDKGRTWFEGSQRRCSTQNPEKIRLYKAQYPAVMLTFDITELDGRDLKNLPYQERKDILFNLLDNAQEAVKPLPHVIENKREFFNKLVARGEEGVILKKLGSPYLRTRSKHWLKVKKWQTERVKVVGFTEGIGARAGYFGSLVIAKVEDNGSLVYRGKVGSGFSHAEVKKLAQMLRDNQTDVLGLGKPMMRVKAPDDYTPVDIPLELIVKFFEETKNRVIRFPSMMKDKQGNNMIYFDTTIEGVAQKPLKQSTLKGLLDSLG